MAKTIRGLLIEESHVLRGLHGHFDAEAVGVFQVMMSYPEEDHRFLNEVDKRADGADWLSMLIDLFDNSNRERLFTVVRAWSETTGKRRLLDVVERCERCMKHQGSVSAGPK